MRPLLILRPEPGASRTAARARAAGLEPIVSPLFRLRPLPWQAPAAEGFEAVLLTSANATRLAGDALERYRALPCYAVGEATAEEAAASGFPQVRTGPSDGAAAAAMMRGDGIARALHLCGRDHLDLGGEGLRLERVAVYAADPVPRLEPEAADAIAREAVVLVHSPRAAALLDRLAQERSRAVLVAFSDAAAAAAGDGWAECHVASRPRDEALLELAARLCQTAAPEGRQGRR
jgi:uroporphyrinogen-III synthase